MPNHTLGPWRIGNAGLGIFPPKEIFAKHPRTIADCHTRADDPAWCTEDGDYGCDKSPESGPDGCGDHARAYDLALMLVKANQ
jgi:hypothetical protein